jgi:hypothetical protein
MSYLNKIYNKLKITSAPTEADDVARKNETDALDAAKAGIVDDETISGTWEIQDDIPFDFGTDGDVRLVYDSTAGTFDIEDTVNTVTLASFAPNGPVDCPNGLQSGSSPVLTQADEGAGNGLDADTVDGEQAAAFADAAHNHTGDNLGTATTPVSAIIATDLSSGGTVFRQRTDPSTTELGAGNSMVYTSDGASGTTGAAGDLVYAVNDGGTIKTSVIAEVANAT